MPYTSNIPQATDQLSLSQGQILGNFGTINTSWLVNHGDFNGGNAGKHMFLQFPTVPNAQVAAVPVMGAGEIGLVSQVSDYTAVPELQVIRPGGNNVVEFTSAEAANAGWTRLPSGILLKWGFQTLTNVATTVTYPVAADIPVFANVFQTMITPFAYGGVVYTLPVYVVGGVTYNTTEFNIVYQGVFSANTIVSYLTIGD